MRNIVKRENGRKNEYIAGTTPLSVDLLLTATVCDVMPPLLLI